MALVIFKILQQGFMKKALAFTWSHNDPYLRGSIVAYPFDWLEASYQYTDVNNICTVQSNLSVDLNHIKIKALILKQGFLKKENIYLPSQ